MLSYIKRKLSESDSTANSTNSNTDAQLARKTSQMSLGSGTSATTTGNNEGDDAVAIGEDALLHELGYKNANDLQETVYGEWVEKSFLHIRFDNYKEIKSF